MVFKFLKKESETNGEKPLTIGKNNIFKCPYCSITFKLLDKLVLKGNKVRCIKCYKITKVKLSVAPPKIKPSDTPLKEKDEKYHKMYDYIYRYYRPKNDDFKNVIKELCSIKTIVGGVSISCGFTAISPHSFDKEIKNEIENKLSNKDLIKRKKYGIFKYSGIHIVKLYEDIKKFYNFFPTKGIVTTYKEILTIFKDIIDEEELNELVDEYFTEIKNKVTNRESGHEITKAFIEQIIIKDNDNLDISSFKFRKKLNNHYLKYLPQLFAKFGITYDDKIEDLQNIFNEVIDILSEEHKKKLIKAKTKQLDDFESKLDSSYGNLLKEDTEDFDDDIDDDLLSDYLDEDNDDKK